MPRDSKLIERLTAAAETQEEPIPGLPLVELAGDRRVLIEHHFGVTEYSRDLIGVKVRFGTVVICGNDLRLARMTREALVICGCIDSIKLLRRRR